MCAAGGERGGRGGGGPAGCLAARYRGHARRCVSDPLRLLGAPVYSLAV